MPQDYATEPVRPLLKAIVGGALLLGSLFCVDQGLLSADSESAWGTRPSWMGPAAMSMLIVWLAGMALQLWHWWMARPTGHRAALVMSMWLAVVVLTYAAILIASGDSIDAAWRLTRQISE